MADYVRSNSNINAIQEQSIKVDEKHTAVMRAKNRYLRMGIIYKAKKEIAELEVEREKLHNLLTEGGYLNG
jgi:hypothetical protein